MIKDCFVVCGMLAAFFAGSQVSETRDQPAHHSDDAMPESRQWPPRPENILNQSGTLVFDGKRKQGPIYKVPAGKTLVVTLIKTTTAVDVCERHNGRDELKLSYVLMSGGSNQFPGSRSSVIGLTFAPRSLVMLKEPQGLRGKFYYHVRGYLIPAQEPERKK